MEKMSGLGGPTKPSIENTKQSKRNEHLKNASPIMSAFGTQKMFRGDQHLEQIKDDGDAIDFFSGSQKRFGGKVFEMAYAISTANEKDKWSMTYRNCTGVIVAGTDKTSGKQISLLTHQSPRELFHNALSGNKAYKKFIVDMKKSIGDLVSRCTPGSVDAVILGGNVAHYSATDFQTMSEDYRKSIKLLGEVCTEKLGFEPVVLTGPNMDQSPNPFSQANNWDVDAYFDTQNRRLYLLRAEVKNNDLNHEYLPSELDTMRPQWE